MGEGHDIRAKVVDPSIGVGSSQSLTVAKLAVAIDDHDRARSSVDEALTTVQRIVAQLLTSTRSNGFAAGSLVRDHPREHDSLGGG